MVGFGRTRDIRFADICDVRLSSDSPCSTRAMVSFVFGSGTSEEDDMKLAKCDLCSGSGTIPSIVSFRACRVCSGVGDRLALDDHEKLTVEQLKFWNDDSHVTKETIL